MKDASAQYKTKDLKITTSTKVIESKVKTPSKSPSGSQSSQSSSQPSSSAQSQPRSQSLLPQSGGGGQRSASRHSSERNKKKMKNPPTKQINQIQLKHKIDSMAWRIVWILVRLKIFFT